MFQPSFIPDFSGFADLIPLAHGGADAAGGGLVGLLDKLLENMTRNMEPGGSFQLLPGIQAMGPNIHPALVHFPIAFLSAFFLLELLGTFAYRERLGQASGPMLYCGTLGAVLAAAAGLYAAGTVPHGQSVHETMEWHERIGLTVTGLALVLSAWRLLAKRAMDGMARALQLILAGIMTVGVMFGADLGGLMVYQHGVAVQNLQQSDDAQQHQHGGTPADGGHHH